MKNVNVRVPLRIDSNVISREIVIAEPTPAKDRYVLKSIPAYAYGIATGDLFEIADYESGEFFVLKRGGQVSVRLFVAGPLKPDKLTDFKKSILNCGGVFEIGKKARSSAETSILLASLRADLGISKIAELVKAFRFDNLKWEFGNVYDDSGKLEAWLSNSSLKP